MPSGVYPRTQNQLKASIANLAKGRAPEVRADVRVKLKKNAESEEWRRMVGEHTKAAMHKPEIRQKHLQALARNMIIYGAGYRGGRNQEPLPIMAEFAKILELLGFIQELHILTRNHGTGIKAPLVYYADFGHPDLKIVIELDGVSHCGLKSKLRDEKRTTVLRALGWEVFRLKHAQGFSS